jgi:hypothetical protein
VSLEGDLREGLVPFVGGLVLEEGLFEASLRVLPDGSQGGRGVDLVLVDLPEVLGGPGEGWRRLED